MNFKNIRLTKAFLDSLPGLNDEGNPEAPLDLQKLQKINERKLFLYGPVENYTSILCNAITLLREQDCLKPILLYINSFGGSWDDMVEIINTIRRPRNRSKAPKAPVYGIVLNYAHSGAFYILQACDLRLMRPHCQCILHACDFGGIRADEPDRYLKIYETEHDHKIMMRRLSRRTGQTLKTLGKLSKAEKVLDAALALRLNIIDDILKW